ncbi:hypothetical protein FGO68_gene1755 [Halteria grandinella]|uniref:Uncharacterized protein n=1 Tax=Halteria grandinella TaxID=5974 RepID=A0A8J8T9S2_HALGN|nr:hypothetical protein FGO68_gene1755 [Halteria grandinella]
MKAFGGLSQSGKRTSNMRGSQMYVQKISGKNMIYQDYDGIKTRKSIDIYNKMESIASDGMMKLHVKIDSMITLMQNQQKDIEAIRQSLNSNGILIKEPRKTTQQLNLQMANIIEEENENQSKESSNISISDDTNSDNENVIKLNSDKSGSSQSLSMFNKSKLIAKNSSSQSVNVEPDGRRSRILAPQNLGGQNETQSNQRDSIHSQSRTDQNLARKSQFYRASNVEGINPMKQLVEEYKSQRQSSRRQTAKESIQMLNQQQRNSLKITLPLETMPSSIQSPPFKSPLANQSNRLIPSIISHTGQQDSVNILNLNQSIPNIPSQPASEPIKRHIDTQYIQRVMNLIKIKQEQMKQSSPQPHQTSLNKVIPIQDFEISQDDPREKHKIQFNEMQVKQESFVSAEESIIQMEAPKYNMMPSKMPKEQREKSEELSHDTKDVSMPGNSGSQHATLESIVDQNSPEETVNLEQRNKISNRQQQQIFFAQVAEKNQDYILASQQRINQESILYHPQQIFEDPLQNNSSKNSSRRLNETKAAQVLEKLDNIMLINESKEELDEMIEEEIARLQ